MPPAKPFEFLDVALPPDGDLRLVLAECMPAENGPRGVPARVAALSSGWVLSSLE